jgi:DNA topoisomerase IA
MASITRGADWLHQPLTVGSAPLSQYSRPGQPSSGGPLRVLCVAEKPSVAAAIARALADRGDGDGDGDGHAQGGRGGGGGATPLHTLRGVFHGAQGREACEYVVTSVCGHVTTVDYAEDLSDWAAVDPLSLFSAPTKRAVCAGPIAQHLSRTARDCDVLVCCTDGDREGEHIAVEIAAITLPQLRTGRTPRAYRALFSGLGPVELRAAFARLGGLDRQQAAAVDCRQEVDLKVGTALTRLQTLFVAPRWDLAWARCKPRAARAGAGSVVAAGDEEDSDEEEGSWEPVCRRVGVVPYGPCQTPTLTLVCERAEEAERYVHAAVM